MNRMTKVALLGVLAAGGLLGGCTKEVTCVFSNTTDRSLSVQIIIPGEIPEDVGVLAPASSGYQQKIKIKNEDLPQTVTFKGGEQTVSQTIKEDTADRIWIDFTPSGPQVRTSEKMRVVQKKETTVGPIITEQETVVE
jgi:hypothetical protein